MSDKTKESLERVAIVVGVVAGLAGLFGAFFVMPYRMDAAEDAIKEVQIQARTDHDLIQRIDVRTDRMEKTQQEQMTRIEGRLDRLTK